MHAINVVNVGLSSLRQSFLARSCILQQPTGFKMKCAAGSRAESLPEGSAVDSTARRKLSCLSKHHACGTTTSQQLQQAVKYICSTRNALFCKNCHLKAHDVFCIELLRTMHWIGIHPTEPSDSVQLALKQAAK
jgi:hypothetical protein